MELEIMMLYSSETMPLSCIESRLRCIYAHMHTMKVLKVYMHICMP